MVDYRPNRAAKPLQDLSAGRIEVLFERRKGFVKFSVPLVWSELLGGIHTGRGSPGHDLRRHYRPTRRLSLCWRRQLHPVHHTRLATARFRRATMVFPLPAIASRRFGVEGLGRKTLPKPAGIGPSGGL